MYVNKMKQLLAMSLIAVCAVGSLSGCGNHTSEVESQSQSVEQTEASQMQIPMVTENDSASQNASNATESDTAESNITDVTEAQSDTAGETEAETEAEQKLKIVLDPGHDSEYCTRNHPELDVNEQDLNLAIGLACRDQLKKYDGVAVYMTREDGSCPDAEDKGEYCIEKRTGYATELDADLFVSLHCNGTTGVYGASANGAEVYVPNYSQYTNDMTTLGNLILDNLTEFDIASNGVKVRTKAEKGHYDDGSVQDWYYLLSYSVEGGHPGIIIEHAYMDNAHDNAILKEDENLKAIGEADADAIAAYYGLKLK